MTLLHLTAGQGPAECRLAVPGLVAAAAAEARAAGLAVGTGEEVAGARIAGPAPQSSSRGRP